MNSSFNNEINKFEEEKILQWAKSMGYEVPYKFNGCLMFIIGCIGLAIGVVPGLVIFFYLYQNNKEYKEKIKSLEFKWIDAGKPQPGQSKNKVRNLKRIEESNTAEIFDSEADTESNDDFENKIKDFL